jgi:hypothetical protein
VRPNSGRIEPSGHVEIQVLLQTMKEDPPLDVRCKDKFLVQSVSIPADTAEGLTVSQIWSGIEATNKSSIQEKKIRVVFLPADGQQHQSNGAASSVASGLDNSHYSEDNPPAYSSPSPQAATPQRSQPTGPVSTFDEKPDGAKSRGDAVNSAYNPAQSSGSGLAGAAAAVSNAIPTSQDDVRRQLDEAKATISRLQEQASSGLRQRNVAGSEEKSSTQNGLAAKATSTGGVSVQIVALLCLLCFLIAYFFF